MFAVFERRRKKNCEMLIKTDRTEFMDCDGIIWNLTIWYEAWGSVMSDDISSAGFKINDEGSGQNSASLGESISMFAAWLRWVRLMLAKPSNRSVEWNVKSSKAQGWKDDGKI